MGYQKCILRIFFYSRERSDLKRVEVWIWMKIDQFYPWAKKNKKLFSIKLVQNGQKRFRKNQWGKRKKGYQYIILDLNFNFLLSSSHRLNPNSTFFFHFSPSNFYMASAANMPDFSGVASFSCFCFAQL